MYRRRRAIIEGRKPFLGLFGGEPETVNVTVKDRAFFAPEYRTLSCPEEYLDCRAILGDGPVWRQMSWEGTQFGVSEIQMAMYANLKPMRPMPKETK